MRLTCEALVNFLVAAGTSVTVRDRYGVYVPQKYTDTFNSIILSLALHTVIDGTFVPASIYGQLNAENDVEERSTLYFSPQFDRRALLDYYDHNQSVASSKFHYLIEPCVATLPMISKAYGMYQFNMIL